MEDYFKVISNDLQNKANLIKEYFKIHSGENGRNKEDLLLEFLRSYLPKRYSLGTGFILDSSETKSNQNDIIIYDSFWSSILFPDSVSQFFPIESVYGVIEVKSKLDKKELKTTIAKAAKVKKMPTRGISKRAHSSGIKEPLYAIFAYDSLELSTVKEQLEAIYKDTPLKERIDFIVVLNKGLIYTGNYFDIVTYGQENSSYRQQLGKEGIDKLKEQCPYEIAGMELSENSLLIWYMYIMKYLSFSSDKISNWMDYLPNDKAWGKYLK